MAAEYSRELGVKVYAGQKRLAELGFKQGGCAGYGLRRMLVSSDGVRKQELAFGERKSLFTDRVILVPGPAEEVQCVRNIYRMLVEEGRTVHSIVTHLKKTGVPSPGKQWDYNTLNSILSRPKYMGCHVFGRDSTKLCTRAIHKPTSEWTLTSSAFEPIIDPVTFRKAQHILLRRTHEIGNEEFLEKLRTLLTEKGKLTGRLITQTPNMPGLSTYLHRFGTLREAFMLAGYDVGKYMASLDVRLRTKMLREQLVSEIVKLFPHEVTVIQRQRRFRKILRFRNGRLVSLLIARTIPARDGQVKWRLRPTRREIRSATVIARLNSTNTDFHDFYLFPRLDRLCQFQITLHDKWLDGGRCLASLSELREATQRMFNRSRKKKRSKSTIDV